MPRASHFALLDLEHLSHQTSGDTLLERELLNLFRQRAPELLDRMHTLALTPHGSALCDLAHQLRGSALALGTFAVAAAAEMVEHAFAPNAWHDDGGAVFHASGEAALATLAFNLTQALAAIEARLNYIGAPSAEL
jgi:HPt (histidine-containing phosphotransfer) domain-containing protein